MKKYLVIIGLILLVGETTNGSSSSSSSSSISGTDHLKLFGDLMSKYERLVQERSAFASHIINGLYDDETLSDFDKTNKNVLNLEQFGSGQKRCDHCAPMVKNIVPALNGSRDARKKNKSHCKKFDKFHLDPISIDESDFGTDKSTSRSLYLDYIKSLMSKYHEAFHQRDEKAKKLFNSPEDSSAVSDFDISHVKVRQLKTALRTLKHNYFAAVRQQFESDPSIIGRAKQLINEIRMHGYVMKDRIRCRLLHECKVRRLSLKDLLSKSGISEPKGFGDVADNDQLMLVVEMIFKQHHLKDKLIS